MSLRGEPRQRGGGNPFKKLLTFTEDGFEKKPENRGKEEEITGTRRGKLPLCHDRSKGAF